MSTAMNRGTIVLKNDYHDTVEYKLKYSRNKLLTHIGWTLIKIGCFLMFAQRVRTDTFNIAA